MYFFKVIYFFWKVKMRASENKRRGGKSTHPPVYKFLLQGKLIHGHLIFMNSLGDFVWFVFRITNYLKGKKSPLLFNRG